VGLWLLTGLFNNNLSMALKVLAEESRGKIEELSSRERTI